MKKYGAVAVTTQNLEKCSKMWCYVELVLNLVFNLYGTTSSEQYCTKFEFSPSIYRNIPLILKVTSSLNFFHEKQPFFYMNQQCSSFQTSFYHIHDTHKKIQKPFKHNDKIFGVHVVGYFYAIFINTRNDIANFVVYGSWSVCLTFNWKIYVYNCSN